MPLVRILLLLGILSYTLMAQQQVLHHPEERSLHGLRQFTAGGTNAEACVSFDEAHLILQSTRPPFSCDQIFIMPLDGRQPQLVSMRKGRTTCGCFLPGDRRIIFASTHASAAECPPPPNKSMGYVRGVFDAYDTSAANRDGSDPLPLAAIPGYDAEATVSPMGDRTVFTSPRDGDLELSTMNIDGSDLVRITHAGTFNAFPMFTRDGRRQVFVSDRNALNRYELNVFLADWLDDPEP